jgi:RNA polymerase sigma-70 factor, ECF subfamily
MNLSFHPVSFVHQTIELKPVTKEVDDLYKQLFYQYFQSLCSYALTIVRDADSAKDVVQTAYIKLWEKRNEINFNESARPYLYSTVYRLSLNVVRNHETRRGHHEEIKKTSNPHQLNSLESNEISKRILATIEQLPERCKEVFCKAKFEGKKYAEVGEELGISVKTVEVQMGKALRFLREKLSDLSIFIILHFLFQ